MSEKQDFTTLQKSPSSEPDAEVSSLESKANLKLDRRGLPLIPQPSNYNDDPLNWPSWRKWAVLLQVSILAFLATFMSAVINPGLVVLGKSLQISTHEASYQTTTFILMLGVGPIIWIPIANVYGRRPVYLTSAFIATVACFGSGAAQNWAGLVAARAITGLAASAAMALGVATVNDMFFLHERATKIGIWTVLGLNGPHVAPIGGGYLVQNVGWRWAFYMPAIVNAAMLALMVFALPETLFSRSKTTLGNRQERTYFQMLFNYRSIRLADRHIKIRDFVRPFEMLRYPSVVLPCIFHVMGLAYCVVLPNITIAAFFNEFYGFKAGIIGLTMGLPIFIGTSLGEVFAGPLSDFLMYRYAKKHNGERKPEARLPLLFPSMLLQATGLIVFGVCLHYRTHWIWPCIGTGISGFGAQIAATITYAYCSDCYKPQSGEIGVVFNFIRLTYAFTIGFYMIPFAQTAGIQWALVTVALIIVLSYLGIPFLMWKGESIRKKLGPPRFHADI